LLDLGSGKQRDAASWPLNKAETTIAVDRNDRVALTAQLIHKARHSHVRAVSRVVVTVQLPRGVVEHSDTRSSEERRKELPIGLHALVEWSPSMKIRSIGRVQSRAALRESARMISM